MKGSPRATEDRVPSGSHPASVRRAADENEDRRAGRVFRLVLIVLLALTLACSVHGLARALANQVPLRLILGQRWWAATAALVASIGLGICALARELSRLREGKPAEAPLAFLRQLTCVAVIGWLVFLWRVQPFQRIHFDLALGLVAGTFSALIAAEPWLDRLPPRLRRAADIIAFNLCLTAVLGELGLRTLSEWKPSPILARVASNPGHVLEQNRCRPGQPRFGFRCNTTGHYDEEFRRKQPGEQLVLTIGDSFSIGVVPHRLHFTTVCERELGIPVYNMGVAGTDPPEYLHMLLNEALPLDPDLVVIDVFVGNDLVYPNVPPNPSDHWLRSWFDSTNVLLCIVPPRLVRLANEQRSRTKEQGTAGIVQGERTATDEGSGADFSSRFPWVVDPGLESPTFSERTFQEVETVRARQVCTDSAGSYPCVVDSLLDIQKAAGRTAILVMLIPDEFQVEDTVWQSVLSSAPDATLERDRPQRILLPWFERNGIPCLDLLPVLRQTPPLADGRLHLYHLRDTHFNARGNQVAGEALAKFLRVYMKPPQREAIEPK